MFRAKADIYIDLPPQAVWSYIADYQNFATFLSHIKEVKRLDDKTLEWKIGGPLGIPLSWKTVITQRDPPRLLVWESIPGPMETYSWMSIESEGPGSRVTMSLFYNPPRGAVSEIFSRMFKDPQTILDHDLKKLEAILVRKPLVSGL
jgi:uncharacterized membrane protein